ncbi:hypothetical protein [Caproicibacter sp.]|uniref:hypothetical protein n=1 Tax=Caproicibacter sp. TaxID=2814884 RepID=UPI0039892F50
MKAIPGIHHPIQNRIKITLAYDPADRDLTAAGGMAMTRPALRIFYHAAQSI